MARQYGEPAPQERSACGGAVFAVRGQNFWPLLTLRYRVVKVLVNYPGAVKFIGSSRAPRVCQAVLSCPGSRNRKQKVWIATYPYCPC